MFAMFLLTGFLLILLVSAPALAQVPPGIPYVPARHPNPIITYVELKDFRTATYSEAERLAGIELLGLSEAEGKRTSVETADGGRQKIKIFRREVEVVFYPVVRQVFELRKGGQLVLYSFRTPKSPVPPPVLDEAAFAKSKKPEEERFGGVTKPERIDLRGGPGLLFESDGDSTVFWQEDGRACTATAKLPQDELIRVLEDLL